jgi:hypothetical protein
MDNNNPTSNRHDSNWRDPGDQKSSGDGRGGGNSNVPPEQVAEVCSTIGNLLRIALAVQPEEARAACEAAAKGSVEALVLDPHRSARTPADIRQNQRLFESFLEFRLRLQMARAGVHFDDPSRP